MINKIIIEVIRFLEATQSQCDFLPQINATLTGASTHAVSQVVEKVTHWLEGKRSMLEFKVKGVEGLYIRLNRSHFNVKFEYQTCKLGFNSEKAVSIYTRYRERSRAPSRMKLVTYMSENADQLVENVIRSIKIMQQEKKPKLIQGATTNVPTLAEFLPTYASLCNLENPNTTTNKVNIIKNNFSYLKDYPINKIGAAELVEYLEQCRTTAKRVNDNRYKFSESTLKNYVCTLRALLKKASKFNDHPFELCPSLYGQVKFRTSKAKFRDLDEDSLRHLIASLALRDKKKLRPRQSACRYADHLTPLVLLGLSTGLRPMYSLNIKWNHIDFKRKKIMILGGAGKIKETKMVNMTSELVKILREWKKHAIHSRSSTNWLFPSPVKREEKLKYYKTALNTFRKQYNLENFVMYDVRHTFATLYTEHFQDIYATRDALHHENVQTTQRYAHALETTVTKGFQPFEENKPSFVECHDI